MPQMSRSWLRRGARPATVSGGDDALDVAAQPPQAQTHTSLDGSDRNTESRSDLAMRVLAEERQRERLSLSGGKLIQQADQLAGLSRCHDGVDHALGRADGVQDVGAC